MKSPKKLLTCILCLLIVAVSLSLSACDITQICLFHQWSKWSVAKSATCTESGVQKHTCARCGKTETELTPPTGHTPDADDGDCTTEVACSVCGIVLIEERAHAFDHACDTDCNNEGCEHTRATEHTPNADDGDCTTEVTCSVCEAVTTEANTQHTGGSATCEHKAECENCGIEYGELGNHQGQLIWIKHMDSHYQVYSCCYKQATEAEGHTIVDGVCTECGFHPTISMGSVEATPGATQVVIAVSIADNPGITGLMATLQYSADVLTLVEARSADALSVLTFTSPSSLSSGCTFMWDGVEVNDRDIKDGEFLILTFDVSQDAPAGEYSILLNINAFDNDLNRVSLRVEGGKVTINNN